MENLIDEIVPLLSITTSVAGIIQFDAASWFHGEWVAEQKIDVLAVDPVPVALVLVGPNHEEDVGQIYFRADDRPSADRSHHHTEKRKLRRREEIITLAERQLTRAFRLMAQLDAKEAKNCG